MTFLVNSWHVEWVTIELQNIPPKHRDLRQIAIRVPCHLIDSGADVKGVIGDRIFREWMDLDRLFVRLWEACSIRPEVACSTSHKEKQEMRDCFGCLLPEIKMRGIIDLVQ